MYRCIYICAATAEFLQLCSIAWPYTCTHCKKAPHFSTKQVIYACHTSHFMPVWHAVLHTCNRDILYFKYSEILTTTVRICPFLFLWQPIALCSLLKLYAAVDVRCVQLCTLFRLWAKVLFVCMYNEKQTLGAYTHVHVASQGHTFRETTYQQGEGSCLYSPHAHVVVAHACFFA